MMLKTPETTNQRRKQLSGDAISSLLYPSKPMKKPKDYVRENVKQLRQVQKQNKLLKQKEEEEKKISLEVEKIKKEIKFGHVSPKLYTPNRSGINSRASSSLNSSLERLSLGPVESTLEGNEKYPCSNTVVLPPIKRTLKPGQLPKYLVDRRAGWAAERAARQELEKLKQSGGAPGLVLLSDVERNLIIEGLENNAEQIRKDLMKLPLTLKSQKVRDKKADLERRLSEVEQDIDKFKNKTKIWVPATEIDQSTANFSSNTDHLCSKHIVQTESPIPLPQRDSFPAHQRMNENINNWLSE